MIDIAITTFQRKLFTKFTIDGIIERTKTPYRLLVFDNGSTDGTVEMLKEYKEKGIINELILSDKNVGLEPAKNKLLELIKSEYFISTDNDMIPQNSNPDWLQQLLTLIKENPEYATIACRTQVMVGTGNIFDEATAIKDFPHPGGSFRIMRTDLVRKVGGWRNEFLNGRGSEERLICGKLRKEGYKVGFAQFIRCYHFFGEGWGYLGMKPEEHGHNPIWPPSEKYDKRVDFNTLIPKDNGDFDFRTILEKDKEKQETTISTTITPPQEKDKKWNFRKREDIPLSLALGCGKSAWENHVNIDIRDLPNVDLVCDVMDLPYDDDYVDNMTALDVVEHFGTHEWRGLLKHWVSKLKKGGHLHFRVPDIRKAVEIHKDDDDYLIRLIFGGQEYLQNTHKTGFTKKLLERELPLLGLGINTLTHNAGGNLTADCIKL